MMAAEEDVSLGPKTTRDFLVEIHKDVQDVKSQVEKTNGRVTVLERFMWITIGASTSGAALTGALKLAGVL